MLLRDETDIGSRETSLTNVRPGEPESGMFFNDPDCFGWFTFGSESLDEGDRSGSREQRFSIRIADPQALQRRRRPISPSFTRYRLPHLQ